MLTRYFTFGMLAALLAALFLGERAGGVVASIVFGFMAGNFACSLVHRLPRGRAILEEKPYCGECRHPLSEMDLLPVFGALMLGHKCRYCKAPIPMTHFWTEILLGALFAFCYWSFGFSQEYLLLAALGTFFVVLVSIEHNEGIVMERVLIVTVVFGALWRTLMDANIYDFFLGGVIAGILGAFLWRKEVKPVRHVYTFPDGAKLLAAGGICAGQAALPGFLLVWAVCWMICFFFRLIRGNKGKAMLSLPLALAVMITLLWDPGTQALALLRL